MNIDFRLISKKDFWVNLILNSTWWCSFNFFSNKYIIDAKLSFTDAGLNITDFKNKRRQDSECPYGLCQFLSQWALCGGSFHWPSLLLMPLLTHDTASKNDQALHKKRQSGLPSKSSQEKPNLSINYAILLGIPQSLGTRDTILITPQIKSIIVLKNDKLIFPPEKWVGKILFTFICLFVDLYTTT